MEYYSSELREAERCLCTERRKKAEHPADTGRIAGLALSGGGIRSATFCLGFLQALARAGVLRRFDFLSTVSGGGYIGSFLGKWIHAKGIDVVEDQLPRLDSGPVAFLRENGRYLAPNGTGDAVAAAAAYFRDWLTCNLVLGTAGLAFFLGVEAVRGEIPAVGFLAAGTVQWSPFWLGAGILLFFFNIPLAFAYWLPTASLRRAPAPWLLLLFVALVLWKGNLELFALHPRFGLGFKVFVGFVLLFSVLGQILAWVKSADWVRLKSTQVLGWGIVCLAAVAVLSLTDTLVLTVYGSPAIGAWLKGAASLPVLVGAAYKLMPYLTEYSKKTETGAGQNLLIAAAAALVGIGILFMQGLFAHALAEGTTVSGWFGAWPCTHPGWARAAATVFMIVVAALLGRAGFWFVNFTSFHRIYSQRLTRAYLGASNPERQGEAGSGAGGPVRNWDMTALLPNDNIRYGDYRPHEKGGPIHLINATVNETASDRSNTEKRDRKGFGMSLGPAGITAGRADYLAFGNALDAGERRGGFRGYVTINQRVAAGETGNPQPVKIEMMSLGGWVGVSGAAVSTGMGARTNLSFSFLLGYFNIRLGYWWDSGITCWIKGGGADYKLSGTLPGRLLSAVLPAQMALLSEFFADFHGPDRRRWYLSDGGHFENTGVYELIRREAALIVCCDCGRDADYAFEDLANLVRKARIDFGADIRFLETGEIEGVPYSLRGLLGTLEEVRPAKAAGAAISRAAKNLTVARITYFNGLQGILLVVKPALAAGCPLDLANYAAANPAFPQQSTLEQFFDEAQWESHRKLGQCAGDALFGGERSDAAHRFELLRELAEPCNA